ncbi:hypothetical protein M433DRAFT_438123 [Acidomyces richmondensis BFW]|nr:hypothetical protein M433DRAFT_438123 [Acidomyces richmondensis BFW]
MLDARCADPHQPATQAKVTVWVAVVLMLLYDRLPVAVKTTEKRGRCGREEFRRAQGWEEGGGVGGRDRNKSRLRRFPTNSQIRRHRICYTSCNWLRAMRCINIWGSASKWCSSLMGEWDIYMHVLGSKENMTCTSCRTAVHAPPPTAEWEG